MTTTPQDAAAIGLLLVDPYNDFLSERGKLWPLVKSIAEEEGLLEHLRQILAAARAACGEKPRGRQSKTASAYRVSLEREMAEAEAKAKAAGRNIVFDFGSDPG